LMNITREVFVLLNVGLCLAHYLLEIVSHLRGLPCLMYLYLTFW
jgi:hypothetical protein